MEFVQEISSKYPTRLHSIHRFLSWIAAAFGKAGTGNDHHAMLEQDLLRLSEISPHLLEDIGFSNQVGESDPTRHLWQKGHVLLELPASEEAPTGRS